MDKEQTTQHTNQLCAHESDLALLNQVILAIKDTLTSMRDLMTSNAVLEEQVSTLNREMKNVKRDMVEVNSCRPELPALRHGLKKSAGDWSRWLLGGDAWRNNKCSLIWLSVRACIRIVDSMLFLNIHTEPAFSCSKP